MEDLPSQTKMEASGEGNFSVSMNMSSRGKAGPGPLHRGGGCTCKNSNGDAHQIFPV